MITKFRLYEMLEPVNYGIGDVFNDDYEGQGWCVIFTTEYTGYQCYFFEHEEFLSFEVIEDEVFKIEELYKENPKKVIELFLMIKPAVDEIGDSVYDEFPEQMELIRRMWVEKIPELEVYWQQEKYNL